MLRTWLQFHRDWLGGGTPADNAMPLFPLTVVSWIYIEGLAKEEPDDRTANKKKDSRGQTSCSSPIVSLQPVSREHGAFTSFGAVGFV